MESSSETYVVRRYCEGDHPALVKLWTTCFPDDPPWNHPSDVIRRKLVQQPDFLFVCTAADGRVVGAVLAGFDGFRGWVNKLATHPRHQHRGVASRLLLAAEAALAELGCPKVNLQVRQDNATVVELYKSVGYEIESLISMGKPMTVVARR